MTSQRPQDLVFTLFGDYLLHAEGAVWMGSLQELLRPLGLSDGAVRTVLSRMARKGWLDTVRSGRKSFYFLTSAGRQLLEEGEARIYHPPRNTRWDGLWYLVSYSIPEEQRALRDKVRKRLQWLGFGQLGNGMWISPHPLRGEINRLAGALELGDHLEIFRAQYQGFSSSGHLVSRCWNLPELDDRYAAFLERHRPAYVRSRMSAADGRLTDDAAFVLRFWLVHEYRIFPRLDPYLPAELLPADWKGGEAAMLFEAYRDFLSEPAERFVQSVVRLAPTEVPGEQPPSACRV
jgi:phenylacetic acid degradation operon negative regulatory protein